MFLLLSSSSSSSLVWRRALTRSLSTSSPFTSPSDFQLSPSETFLKHVKLCETSRELEKLILNSPSECFDVNNVTRAASGLGQLKSHNPRAIAKVLELTKDKRFGPMDLTYICHGINHGKLSKTIPIQLIQQVAATLPMFDNDQLFTLVYCFANRENDNVELCERFYNEVNSRNVNQFQDSDFAIALESFNKWKYPLRNTDLGRKMVTELAVRPLQGFSTMELTIVLERLEYTNPDFFEHFQRELQKRPDHVSMSRYFDGDEDDEDDEEEEEEFEDIVVDENDLEGEEDEEEENLEEEDFDDDEDVAAEENEDDAEKAEDEVIKPPKTMLVVDEEAGEAPKPNFRRFRRRLM
ncbi:hypothetical protein BASA81_000385 [Batrachochytrium salamandrivorans]|nr:hypothetical protein BASA81_000385 [Batrachochytrium salamandrivorans]